MSGALKSALKIEIDKSQLQAQSPFHKAAFKLFTYNKQLTNYFSKGCLVPILGTLDLSLFQNSQVLAFGVYLV